MRGAGLLARLALAFVAFPALGGTGIFVEGASIAELPPPAAKAGAADRRSEFQVLHASHFISAGRSTVIAIRLDQHGTADGGVIRENGRVELLTIVVPPITAAFESGLGDAVQVRYSNVSSAFWDMGCTMRNSSGRVAVRRDGDRLWIEADIVGDADCTVMRARAWEIACKARGHVDRLDRTALTPRYGLAVSSEDQGQILFPRGDAEYGSVSVNCIQRKAGVSESQAAMERAEDRAFANRKRHLGFYDSKLSPFFAEKVMARCASNRNPGVSYQLAMTLDERGRASDIIKQPDMPIVRCLEEAIARTEFPVPPESPFYFHVDMKGGQ